MNVFVGTHKGWLRSIDVEQLAAVIDHGSSYDAVLTADHAWIVVCFDDGNANKLIELHKQAGEARHADE